MVIMTKKQWNKIEDKIYSLETRLIGIELRQSEIFETNKAIKAQKTAEELQDEWMNGENHGK